MTGSTYPTRSLSNFLTQAQLAKALNISVRSAERMRSDGTGPIFHKAGRRVLYRVEDVEVWLAGRSFTSTAEAKESSTSERPVPLREDTTETDAA